MKLKQIQKQIRSELNSFNSIRLQIEKLAVNDCSELEMKELLTNRAIGISKLILSIIVSLEMMENGVDIEEILTAFSDFPLTDDPQSLNLN